MATSQTNRIIEQLRHVLLRDEGGMTDAQLLERFITRRDDAAFAALVRRHGPMVFGACRRLVHTHHDAEDAFQATFLILARKAASIQPPGMVANWLYGVAYHTALKARVARAKRHVKEKQVAIMPEPVAVPEEELWRDLKPLLDRELNRLPDKYRAAIVICEIEGKTRKEAARQLGWPEGTVASRLIRGRTLLARRLAGQGLILSAGSLAMTLSAKEALATVPPALIQCTTKAVGLLAAGNTAAGAVSVQVAMLTEGVLKTMLLAKLKATTAALLIGAVACLGFGVSARVLWAFTAQVDAPASKDDKPDTALEEALAKARCNGKYAMLLHQFKVEKDRDTYKEFQDVGPRDLREYAGQTNLSKGFWVYVYPYWYIWRDLTATPKVKRDWGPEQATGEPDTPEAGDIVTAWASRTPDEQDEWLLLEYAEPVVPRAVVVHETYNPGALYRVTAFRLDGSEVELWQGKDPTSPDEAMGVSVIPVKVDFKSSRIKIYIASRAVPGWNEIDAVGVRDAGGKTHWATSADASSTFAQQPDRVVPRVNIAVMEERLQQLEKEVRELKETNRELKQMLKELKEMQQKNK
jgi:RNA polymerase sigma factor (sigma-70 family)